MPNDKAKGTSPYRQEQGVKTKSDTKVESKNSYINVKNIVLKHLAKYKNELKDEGIKFEPISLGAKSSEINPIAALELKKKGKDGKDSPELHNQREQVVEMVQKLVDGIKTDGERVIVVNVNTPAVDLDKSFDDDQLNFMRKDIFSSIERQLGAKFHEDVEEQWEDAFSAMMDIVESHRKKKN